MKRKDFIAKMNTAIKCAASGSHSSQKSFFLAFGCGKIDRNSWEIEELFIKTKFPNFFDKQTGEQNIEITDYSTMFEDSERDKRARRASVKKLQFFLQKCLDNKFYTTLV